MSCKIERKNYEQLGPVAGPYVHAVKHGQLLFASGVTAFGTAAQGGGVAEEARAIFGRLRELAACESITLASLLKVTIFVTGLDELAALRAVLFETYGQQLPASSLVQVASLFSPEVSIEIEATFGLPESPAS